MSAPLPNPPQGTSAWPRVAQWAAAFILGAAAIVLANRVIPIFDRARPTERERIVVVAVDLNSASKSDILQLPGVGEKMADRILAARDESSGAISADTLRGVKGIGPIRYETLKPHLVGDSAEQFLKPPSKSAQPSKSTGRPAQRKKELPPGTKINVNQASLEELQQLDGIGPVTAAKIVEERKKGPFEKPDDLRRVRGIGPKTMDKIRPFVTVSDSR